MNNLSRTGAEIDFDRYEREGSRAEARRPVCAYCDEPIWDEECYEMESGEYVCLDCIKDYLKDNGYLKNIDDDGEVIG